MRRSAQTLCLVLLLFLVVSLVQAQSAENDPPLLISATQNDERIVQQDLYAYRNDEWQPLTSGGYKRGFSLSPDGRLVAYLTVPDFLKTANMQGEDVSFLLGSVWNVTILDLASGETREIASQPSAAGLASNNQSIHDGIIREAPVWSPDSSALAWTEQDYPLQSPYAARLVTYTLSTGETRILDNALPEMALSADGLPSSFAWGEPGIAVFTNDPKDNAETIRLYDPVAGTTRIIRRPDDSYQETDGPWLPLSELIWVNTDEGASLVTKASEGQWYRLDWGPSGVMTRLNHALEFSSAANPSSSLYLTWNIYAFADEPEWQLFSPDGTVLESWAADSPQSSLPMVLAPSGQAGAYLEDGTLHLWDNGAFSELPIPNDLEIGQLLWGATEVRFGTEYGALG